MRRRQKFHAAKLDEFFDVLQLRRVKSRRIPADGLDFPKLTVNDSYHDFTD